jgi:UDP-N-acetylglucosamine acyltransferase
MTRIHPSAIVDAGAKLADDVEIGPFSVVGPHVTLAAGCRIGPHVVIAGHTQIGAQTEIAPFCSIGGPPQDKKYQGEPTQLAVGARNVIREYCTLNTGTVQGGAITRVGDDNWIMAYVHIAHDCQVGNQTILANNVTLGGHVELADWVFLGGLTGVHQFVKVGAHAMTSAHTYLSQDLPPYVTCAGAPGAPHGLNSEGLRRRGFSAEAIAALRRSYRHLYRSGLSLEQAKSAIAAQIEQESEHAAVLQPLLAFIGSATRGIAR